MKDDLIEFLMSDAEAACRGDNDKMALYLAGVAAGVLDGSLDATSHGFIRKDPSVDQMPKAVPKAVPQAVLTTNEIIERLESGD